MHVCDLIFFLLCKNQKCGEIVNAIIVRKIFPRHEKKIFHTITHDHVEETHEDRKKRAKKNARERG